jgi:putative transcriptional regulator
VFNLKAFDRFLNFLFDNKNKIMILANAKKGALLIAQPSNDPAIIFNRSVILLAEHNHEGSVGFILNKPLKYRVEDLVPSIHADFKIYNGGPVEQDNLYFIHNVPEYIDSSIEISDGIFWGGNFENTKKLINNKIITEDNIRFFLGYAGWTTNQLEAELDLKSWLAIENVDKTKIISSRYSDLWKEKMTRLGGEYLIWGNAPENPNFN